PGAARNPTVSRACGRTPRSQTRHAIQHAYRRRRIRRGNQSLDGEYRQGRGSDDAVPHRRRGSNYQDMFFTQDANDLCAHYIKRKIRSTVNDPAVAERLIPKGYAYGTKRQPLDTNYYETFNKKNVLLVDAKTDGPIEEITETGIRAGGKEYEFDIIVF